MSSKVLNSLFHSVKESIDKAMELENGRISHFEVLPIHLNIDCFFQFLIQSAFFSLAQVEFDI